MGDEIHWEYPSDGGGSFLQERRWCVYGARVPQLTHNNDLQNQSETTFRVAAAICVVSIPGIIKSLQTQASNPNQVNAPQATNTEVIQHMANAFCAELKAGTELKRASVRAGKSARAMGFKPQLMTMSQTGHSKKNLMSKSLINALTSTRPQLKNTHKVLLIKKSQTEDQSELSRNF